jgi:predicted RNA methylase
MSISGSAHAGVITGTVTDGRGRPLAEVSVSLEDAPVPVPDIAALTGGDGSFALGAPSAGGYTVVATGPDGESARISVEVGAAGEAAADVTIVLHGSGPP